jgi:hypothetical protein
MAQDMFDRVIRVLRVILYFLLFASGVGAGWYARKACEPTTLLQAGYDKLLDCYDC